MFLLLFLFSIFGQVDGFRTTVVVEEGEEAIRYVVDFKAGALRVAPEEEDGYILIDTDSRTATLVRTDERIYCRFDSKGIRSYMKNGTLDPKWFPWVYGVAPDLVGNIELRNLEGFRLPDGGRGRHWSVYSKTYDSVVADYWLDPRLSGELFFQWSKVYLDFWGEGDEEQDQAQQARLALYGRLEGFPIKMEERFRLLTRSRILRVEDREALPADAFAIPEDYTAKSPAELLWEDTLRRWFRPKLQGR